MMDPVVSEIREWIVEARQAMADIEAQIPRASLRARGQLEVTLDLLQRTEKVLARELEARQPGERA
jgi:hypothetical protein